MEDGEELFGTRDRHFNRVTHRLRLFFKGRACAEFAEKLFERRIQCYLASVCGEQGCSRVAEPAAERF